MDTKVVCQKWYYSRLDGKKVTDYGYSVHPTQEKAEAFKTRLVESAETYNRRHLDNPKYAVNSGYTKNLKKNLWKVVPDGPPYQIEIPEKHYQEFEGDAEYLWYTTTDPFLLDKDDF